MGNLLTNNYTIFKSESRAKKKRCKSKKVRPDLRCEKPERRAILIFGVFIFSGTRERKNSWVKG